jgi:hypothetical protein
MSLRIVLVLILCGGAWPPAAFAQPQASAPAASERVQGEDHFVAGGSVRLVQPIAGDLVAAGGNVGIDTTVGGDAVVVGGIVRIGGQVGQTLYAGGGQLTLDGTIGRNARIGGGRVEVGPKAVVNGGLSVGGGDVRIDGAVKGYLQVAGGHVLINGPVSGDVTGTGGTIELGPLARIAGRLRYASGSELERDPAARVEGVVERMPMDLRRAERGVRAGRDEREERESRSGWARTRHGPSLLWTAGLMLLAALLAAGLPAFSDRVAATLATRVGMSLLIGFVALVCIPVAALVLFFTLVGIPLALLTLLAYFALLLLGYVMAGVGIGQWLLARWRAADASHRGWRIGAAVLAVLAIALAARIPFLGGFVTCAVLLAGIGALLMQLRTPPAAT